jgi:energy-coupling factor transport system substrate-specific component
MSTMSFSRGGLWEVSSRVIVYSAIGAALYAISAQFSFLIPGTASVSVRPGFAFVTFFGFAFGPIAGFFTGFVGNALADQISGWGLLTSWNWSLAAGVVGLLTGLTPVILKSWMGTPSRMLTAAAVGSAVAVVIGYLIVFSDIVLGTAENVSAAFADNYFPVVVANVITVVILTPILLAAWQPIKEQMGR